MFFFFFCLVDSKSAYNLIVNTMNPIAALDSSSQSWFQDLKYFFMKNLFWLMIFINALTSVMIFSLILY